MIQEHQHTENFAYSSKKGNSDSRAVELQLLSTATDICYRRVITSECPTTRQIERDKMHVLEKAMETLESIEFGLTTDVPCMVRRALLRAYDVFCAENELLDASFYDVSYGSIDNERHQ